MAYHIGKCDREYRIRLMFCQAQDVVVDRFSAYPVMAEAFVHDLSIANA